MAFPVRQIPPQPAEDRHDVKLRDVAGEVDHEASKRAAEQEQRAERDRRFREAMEWSLKKYDKTFKRLAE